MIPLRAATYTVHITKYAPGRFYWVAQTHQDIAITGLSLISENTVFTSGKAMQEWEKFAKLNQIPKKNWSWK